MIDWKKEGDLCPNCGGTLKNEYTPESERTGRRHYYEYFVVCQGCKHKYTVQPALRENKTWVQPGQVQDQIPVPTPPKVKSKKAKKGKFPMNEGDPCPNCLQPVEKRSPVRKIKPGQMYYFEHYLWCPGCDRMFHQERWKKRINQLTEEQKTTRAGSGPKNEGDPCKFCQTPVIAQKGVKRVKKDQKFFYDTVLKCPGCKVKFSHPSSKRAIAYVPENRKWIE